MPACTNCEYPMRIIGPSMYTLTAELGKETARPRVVGAARIDAEKQWSVMRKKRSMRSILDDPAPIRGRRR